MMNSGGNRELIGTNLSYLLSNLYLHAITLVLMDLFFPPPSPAVMFSLAAVERLIVTD